MGMRRRSALLPISGEDRQAFEIVYGLANDYPIGNAYPDMRLQTPLLQNSGSVMQSRVNATATKQPLQRQAPLNAYRSPGQQV